MRETGGFDQYAALDRAIVPLTRVAMRLLASSRAKLMMLDRIAPKSGNVLRQHVHAEPPLRAETVTPAQVRESMTNSAPHYSPGSVMVG